jgi:hypothetical protein
MAGAPTRGVDDRMRQAGLIWNAAVGGYVNGRTINPATGRPYSDGTDVIDHADGSREERSTGRRMYGVNPPGAGAAGGGGGGAVSGNSGWSPWGSGGGDRDRDEMRRKLQELWDAPTPTYDPPTRPYEDDDTSADKAFRNRARERSAHRLKSGVDALDEEMARRGISSGSAMSGGHLSSLFRGAEREAGEADRQITESRSARNRQISDSNYNASLQALRDNQQAALSSKNRLQSLLSFYDMLY